MRCQCQYNSIQSSNDYIIIIEHGNVFGSIQQLFDGGVSIKDIRFCTFCGGINDALTRTDNAENDRNRSISSDNYR